MEQSEKIRGFYNQYGIREWERLDKTAYDRLNYILHMDFVSQYLKEDKKLIEVGCGAGRFSVEFAKSGCDLTLFDISDEQLKIAEKMVHEHGGEDRLKAVYRGDLANMADIQDDEFDVTVCYGAPLNYLYNNYYDGIKELYRITKPGGIVVASVVNRIGVIKMLLNKQDFNIEDFLANPEYWYVHEVVETGNLPEHPEVSHPPRHLFLADELKELFSKAGFNNVQLASSPCIANGSRDRVNHLSSNEKAWNTLVDLELKTYRNQNMLDACEFLLISGQK